MAFFFFSFLKYKNSTIFPYLLVDKCTNTIYDIIVVHL